MNYSEGGIGAGLCCDPLVYWVEASSCEQRKGSCEKQIDNFLFADYTAQVTKEEIRSSRRGVSSAIIVSLNGELLKEVLF